MTNKSRHYYHHHLRYNYNYAPMLLKSCTKHHLGSQKNEVQASWERNNIDIMYSVLAKQLYHL